MWNVTIAELEYISTCSFIRRSLGCSFACYQFECIIMQCNLKPLRLFDYVNRVLCFRFWSKLLPQPCIPFSHSFINLLIWFIQENILILFEKHVSNLLHVLVLVFGQNELYLLEILNLTAANHVFWPLVIVELLTICLLPIMYSPLELWILHVWWYD